jgi:hypothetical protein
MVWPAIAAAAVTAFAEDEQGAGGIQAPPPPDLTNIHIAPVGINLGSILAPFSDGSPENGGYGIEAMSRLMPQIAPPTYTTADYTTIEPLGFSRGKKVNDMLIMAGVAGAIGLSLVMIGKKGK